MEMKSVQTSNDKIKGHSAASNDKIAKSSQKMHGSGTTNEKRLQTNNKLPKVHVQNDASPSQHESAHKSTEHSLALN